MQTAGVADRRRRMVLLGAFLSLAALAYVVSIVVVRTAVAFTEEAFVSKATGGGSPLDVYVDVLTIDPVRQSMDLRLDVATGPGPHGTHYGGTFDRDVVLHVSDGDTQEELLLRRNGRPSSRFFSVGLNGAIGHYPFDRYSAQIVLSAHETSSNNVRTAIPVRATVWEGVPSWALIVAKVPPVEASGELALRFGLHRPAAHVFFACVIYGLMLLIAISGGAIAALVFVGARRVELGQVTALAAMVFALPALRNVLPGGPPLGVLADVFILLWAELAVALALTLVVAMWVQHGSDR